MDYSKVKRDPDYEAVEVHYKTPGGTRTVAGMATIDTVEDESIVTVVNREDTTYTIPFQQVFQIVGHK